MKPIATDSPPQKVDLQKESRLVFVIEEDNLQSMARRVGWLRDGKHMCRAIVPGKNNAAIALLVIVKREPRSVTVE